MVPASKYLYGSLHQKKLLSDQNIATLEDLLLKASLWKGKKPPPTSGVAVSVFTRDLLNFLNGRCGGIFLDMQRGVSDRGRTLASGWG